MNLERAMELVFDEVENNPSLHYEDLVGMSDAYLREKEGGYTEPFGIYLYQRLFFEQG